MYLLKSGLILILVCVFADAEAQTLDAYVDSALKNNPALKMYNFQSEALQQKIKPAKALDDPMLFVGIMNLPVNFSFTQDEMTMTQIGIQQNFSIKKKYSLNGDVLQKEYEASLYDIDVQRLSLIKEIKQSYYDIYAQTKTIETTLSSIEALKNYIQIANARYAAGYGTQQDVFKAQVEISKMQGELISMESMKKDMIAIFNSLLYRNKNDSVNIPENIKFQKVDLNMDAIMMDVEMNNPILLSLQKNISKDSVAYQLAKTSKIPDFNTSLWYGRRQAEMADGRKAKDMLGFSFGLTLPIYAKKKQNPLITASAINIQTSQSRLETAQNEFELMAHHALIDVNKNEQLVSFYSEQLIPQATESLHAGLTGYQENKIDFMTLIDNYLSLYNYQLQYDQAIADYYKAIAELEMITGRKLTMQ